MCHLSRSEVPCKEIQYNKRETNANPEGAPVGRGDELKPVTKKDAGDLETCEVPTL